MSGGYLDSWRRRSVTDPEQSSGNSRSRTSKTSVESELLQSKWRIDKAGSGPRSGVAWSPIFAGEYVLLVRVDASLLHGARQYDERCEDAGYESSLNQKSR